MEMNGNNRKKRGAEGKEEFGRQEKSAQEERLGGGEGNWLKLAGRGKKGEGLG